MPVPAVLPDAAPDEPGVGVGAGAAGVGVGVGVGVDSSDRGRPQFGSWLWHASGGRPEHTKRRHRSPERSIRTRPFQATRYDPCMTLPTEPIGSIPRPRNLRDAVAAAAAGALAATELEALYDDAVRDTLRRFEETGSPVVTDGEQRKPSFATYPVAGLPGLQPDGVVIPFDDGHTRQLPVITQTPFRYATKASTYLDKARGETSLPMKQAVISASAVSLMYPQAGNPRL